MAEHNFNVRPPILFWFDLSTMLACSGMPFMDNDDATVSISTASGGASKNDTNDRKDGSKSIVLPVYVTQVQDDTLSNKSDSPNTSNSSIVDGLPACPPADKVGEFKVTSAVHAGYAFTWFGLSTAGIYMTRMLLKAKGR